MLRWCFGSYLQAIDIFRNALDKVPGNVVAQCGLAAALLGRARQCTSVGALAWAARLLQVESFLMSGWMISVYCNLLMTIVDGQKLWCSSVIQACALQEAADAAHQCTSSNGTVAAAWKLLGDIEVCTTYASYYDVYLLQISQILVRE